MIVYGLTGSIGMGKSTAAHMLSTLGVMVHDSDALARDLLTPKGLAFEEVALTFPAAWDKKQRIIRRDILADIIFNDSNARKKLEAITHPYVRAAQYKFIRKAKNLGQERVVLDIPLLYETGADKRVDKVIVVSAPYFIQAQRVLSRPNMTPELFTKILRLQLPDHEKRKRADYVVQTGQGRHRTFKTLQSILGL